MGANASNWPKWARSQRAQIKNKMAAVKIEKRRGVALTPAEQALWDSCQKALSDLGARVAQQTYDPYSGASGRQGGPSTRQGPAGGVRSVVNGGAPSLGKRR